MVDENKNEEKIFHAAIAKPVSERAAYLRTACGNNPELLSHIENLIRVYDAQDDFLEAPPWGEDVTLDSSSLVEGPGTVIGPYKLLELIGEGGFGAVYMAEQEEPIRRRVAIKIIKLGMDTKRIIARFEAERQALAMMDHPNIAKVFEAGSTDRGRPYFSMELVKGVPITEYCDKNSLDTQQRLELFIDVCKAVEHAHQKGIIHRDIKPSNVMVTLHDGRPVPKIIDFGIAKAMQQRLTEKTLFTEYRQLIGTPEYMSPEQAEFSGLDVDIRTDIYSLGVLLYELITGTTPFEAKQLHSASYDEICRIIRETEPLKPSTRLSTLGDELAEVAKHRQVEAGKLCKTIRGDLDWIVMKALEKDRTRRYETANELAADIERHLGNVPVSAGPPSAGYRLHKFVLRHRAAVITFSLVTAALAIGATTATLTFLTSGRLTGMVEHASGMNQRHVWNVSPSSSLTGGISADGRYLSYVDWTAGNLAVRDLVTDANWLVTENTDSTWKNIDGWAESSTISPDGKQIAYSWYNQKGVNFYDLRIIDVGGTNMRVLYHDASIFFIKPYAWSPDGKNILAYFSDAERNLVDEKTGELFRKAYLMLVSAADGSARVLKTWQKRGYPKMAVFSPGGRFIAYDFTQDDDRAVHDIFLMDLNSGDEVRVVRHPADDRLVGWTPDGRKILFTSDRTSRRGLWMVEVADGAPEDSPRLLMGQFEGQPIGFTRDGSFYYGVPSTASNVYIARLDSAGLEFEGKPELVSSQFVGSTTMGDFSPDGKFLVYNARRLGTGDRVFVVYSVETSGERILTPSPSFRPDTPMSGPRWSPDGQSLLVRGIGQESGAGVYTVDVETGAAAVIASSHGESLRQAVWSPDGKSVYIRSLMSLSRLEVASGQETELYQGEGGPRGFDVSPDGRWLAFYPDLNSLTVLPSAGGDGDPRQVVHWDEGELAAPYAFVRWTPDGEHLLFCKRNNELWKVHVETGEQQQIGPEIENLVHATMHPDGRQIAFTVEQAGSELWVMENFLPE
ncbi:MAG: serine/threonine-protein kinase [Planctomycetes bacterium]|nr:serine/threonine-protein kinase [Planctomycetota bacterium]